MVHTRMICNATVNVSWFTHVWFVMLPWMFHGSHTYEL